MWHFCSQVNSKKMDKVQFKALLFYPTDDFNSLYGELRDKGDVVKGEKLMLYVERLKVTVAY